MIVDAHVHLYPPEVTRDPAGWAHAAGEPHWTTLCTRRRADGRAVQSFPTVDELLREMDAAGVARTVLLGWYWQKSETCAWQNRFYAECVRAHPDRLAAFATLQPSAGTKLAIEELRRAHSEGLIGVGELSPHSQGYAIDADSFGAVVALAGELRMPVNLHVTDPASRPYPGRVETPLADFSRIARAWPRTTFVLAHWGGLLPLVDASAREMENVFYDTAASPLLYDAGIWSRFIAAVPRERVLFGSDYPLNLYPRLDDPPRMARLIAEARGAAAGDEVLGLNARALLRL